MGTPMEPRLRALEELDRLLASARADGAPPASDCATMIDLLSLVPGRTQAVVDVLAHAPCPAAIDALLRLPRGTAGPAEALLRAVEAGRVREWPGHRAPPMLALEWRRSTARGFPRALERARVAFGARLRTLRLGRSLAYRVALEPEAIDEAAVLDFTWLHADACRRAGSRTWLNGWVLDDGGPVGRTARNVLARAWIDWARRREARPPRRG
jgi:hypothetical protein